MKKRYLILAGLLVMTVAAAGCGKKKTTETAPVEVTEDFFVNIHETPRNVQGAR